MRKTIPRINTDNTDLKMQWDQRYSDCWFSPQIRVSVFISGKVFLFHLSSLGRLVVEEAP